MAPVRNARVLFNEVAKGYPIPGQTTIYDESQTIDLETVPLDGSVLIKTLYLSVDPYMRFRMRDPKEEKNFPLFKSGEPIECGGLGVVLRSENPKYRTGDRIYGPLFPFSEYSVRPGDTKDIVIHNHYDIPWSLYVGVVAMAGLTAYAGWKHYARFKKGDTLFVTIAAGPVGSTVVQLAKADGLRVIASAGTKEKVDFVKSLGADVVFNYKEQDTRAVLAKDGPINIYWDHVGGAITDAVLENVVDGATIIVCGSTAGYNGAPNPMYRHSLIFERDVTIYGFKMHTIMAPYVDDFYREIPKAIANGQLKYREHITKGLEGVPQALLDVQLGINEGKSVIVVAEA